MAGILDLASTSSIDLTVKVSGAAGPGNGRQPGLTPPHRGTRPLPSQKDKVNPNLVSLRDLYTADRKPGRVIGSTAPGGFIRRGVDREHVIGIDDGALRIGWLTRAGWGRAAIAYGPFEGRNGLAFATFLLNGHHASETGPLPERIDQRFGRWAKASGTDPIARRLWRWLLSGQKERFFRKAVHWLNHRGKARGDQLDASLAVGWFASEAPADPPAEGPCFVVRSSGETNGDLWVYIAGDGRPAIRGLPNVPLYLVIILRDGGAAFYSSTIPDVGDIAAYPALQPLGITRADWMEPRYAGIHQGVLGQIGFQVDSRVYGTAIQHLPDYDRWYGTAQSADSLQGQDALADSSAEQGGKWQLWQGQFSRTPEGARPEAPLSLAVLPNRQPAGMIHLQIGPGSVPTGEFGIAWRCRDPQNYWLLSIGFSKIRLIFHQEGRPIVIAEEPLPETGSAGHAALQIVDHGQPFLCLMNESVLFDGPIQDARLAQASYTGIWANGSIGSTWLRYFECHPREIQIPDSLDLGAPWVPSRNTQPVADTFEQPEGALDKSYTSLGLAPWRKELGKGEFRLTGAGSCIVVADTARPNPGRTAYTVPWDNPEAADAEVKILPPGTGRGQGEKCRAGLIFWQDARHYILIGTWLNDTYAGASISSFFYLDGLEDLYDAVWTNVGSRITWGQSFRLRAAFDGQHYMAFVDDRPVLYRALSDVYPGTPRLRIHRVGIAANWEWGDDSGSTFQSFQVHKMNAQLRGSPTLQMGVPASTPGD